MLMTARRPERRVEESAAWQLDGWIKACSHDGVLERFAVVGR